MIVSILIIAVSAVLFLYWFRYTCVLILNTQTSKDFSREVATANQLSFVGIEGQLQELDSQSLDTAQRSLERDYAVVSSLLRQAADLQVGGDSLEELMLRIDFRLMKSWYGLSRRFSEVLSRSAVEEMSRIVGHFANTLGERAVDTARL